MSPRAKVLSDYLTTANDSETLGFIANDLVVAYAVGEISPEELDTLSADYAEAAARVATSEAA